MLMVGPPQEAGGWRKGIGWAKEGALCGASLRRMMVRP